MLKLLIFQISQYASERSELGIVSLRFTFACLLLYLFGSSLVSPLLAAFAKARRMHSIPCTKCQFFTNDHRLKCTIRPQAANTEEAIGCLDYHNLG